MKNKIKEWDKIVKQSKEYVNDVYNQCTNPELRETSNHMQDDFDEFYEVTKAILECEQNPYGFLDNGSYLGSWDGAASFIHSFHHSCIDDGDHCYLSDEIHGPKLVFRWMHDYEPQELYYIVHPESKTFDGENGIENTDRDFEFHTDYKRFIKELSGRPELKRLKLEKFEEMISKLLNK